MNKRLLVLVAVVLSAGVAVMGVSSRGWNGAANAQQADAAYRDGAFQARLDIQRAHRPHFSSGRWNSDQDRAAFIAGYEQTYREMAAASKLAEPTAAELAGYRDGVADGSHDRHAAQPFQVSHTDNYRQTNRGVEASYLQYYREAYSNGYQEGYYSPVESSDLRTISRKIGLF